MVDLAEVEIPQLKDLTIENITENVLKINSKNPDPRFKYILERLVVHLHDFARETRLSTNEWMAGILFLTATGQICTDVRQEFILLSDILGLSLLVDSIDHPKPAKSTEGTVLGPFHTHDAEDIHHGDLLSHDANGKPLLVLCKVNDVDGKPVPGVKIDIWETDSSGFYDVQYADREKPDGRCVMHSDEEGIFWFKAIVPVPYPIPSDGTVGELLKKLKRHCWRPAHMHFIFEKPGFDRLITALYLKGDPYETSDAVFGVKDTLIIDLGKVAQVQAEQYGVEEGSALMTYDFVLVGEEESFNLRSQKSHQALERLGRRVKIVRGLPVPDVV